MAGVWPLLSSSIARDGSAPGTRVNTTSPPSSGTSSVSSRRDERPDRQGAEDGFGALPGRRISIGER